MAKQVLSRFFGVFAITLSVCVAAGTAFARSGSQVSGQVIGDGEYAKVLAFVDISPEDLDNYKKIFKALSGNDLKTAKTLQSRIRNSVLMGHVLALQYTAKDYKSTVTELSAWLKKYEDHPQARQIYAIYHKKGGKNLGLAPNLEREYLAPAGTKQGPSAGAGADAAKFLNLLKQSKNKQAGELLANKMKRSLSAEAYDALAARLAFCWLLDNRNDLAVGWALPAAKRGNTTASWIAGLAYWRMDDFAQAAERFAQTAENESDEWLASSAAYWAYRSYGKLGKSSKAKGWLETAAKPEYRRTFHGILASKRLGRTPAYNWDDVAYFNDFGKSEYLDALLASPAVQRALVLLAIGQTDLAARELGGAYPSLPPESQEAVLYIARQYNMHNLAMRVSKNLEKSGGAEVSYDGASYPVPDWDDGSKYNVDRAFVLALIRQESAFSPEAVSRAGAAGLMQLMPATAMHITKDKSLRKNSRPLLEVEYNLSVGQDYVRYLLEKDYIGGSLFRLIVAYNAGPGNLLKWDKKMYYENDPLLFIEVIPAKETRLYLKRVMANYWIYNARFGKSPKSLDLLDRADWPTF